MAFFAIKGVNHESHGFDHRLCEWHGAKKLINGKFEKVKLEGLEALKALIEAKENPLLEMALGTGAIAMAPAVGKMKQPGSYAQMSDNKAKKPKREVPPGKSVAEDEEKPYDPITGKVEKGKEMVSDDKGPAKSGKAVAKTNDWAKKQPWFKGNKDSEPKDESAEPKEDAEETKDEARRPGPSKKPALHGPRKASLTPPVNMESATPADIGRLITEDPDLLAEGPIGGDHEWPELEREEPVDPNAPDEFGGPEQPMPGEPSMDGGEPGVDKSREPHICSECGEEHIPESSGMGDEGMDDEMSNIGDDDLPIDEPGMGPDEEEPVDDNMSPEFQDKAKAALSDTGAMYDSSDSGLTDDVFNQMDQEPDGANSDMCDKCGIHREICGCPPGDTANNQDPLYDQGFPGY